VAGRDLEVARRVLADPLEAVVLWDAERLDQGGVDGVEERALEVGAPPLEQVDGDQRHYLRATRVEIGAYWTRRFGRTPSTSTPMVDSAIAIVSGWKAGSGVGCASAGGSDSHIARTMAR